MPSTSQWVAFLVASFLFIQVPGPSLLFALGRALTTGRRQALLSVAGNAAGVFVQVLLVALGLGALVAASATAYTVLKIVGAAYVVWLGVQAIRHRTDARVALLAGGAAGEPDRAAFGTGLVVGLTNPKTIVFLLAFLPQFAAPGSAAAPQVVVLGAAFCGLALVSDGVWTLVAGATRRWFARDPARLDRLGVAGGVMMIGLGTSLAVSRS